MKVWVIIKETVINYDIEKIIIGVVSTEEKAISEIDRLTKEYGYCGTLDYEEFTLDELN